MTHDPDHDQRAMNPDLSTTNGLSDRRLDQAYRDAQRGPQDAQRGPQDHVPWELRGARRPHAPAPRSGPSTTTRVLIALLLVLALVAALVGRW